MWQQNETTFYRLELETVREELRSISRRGIRRDSTWSSERGEMVKRNVATMPNVGGLTPELLGQMERPNNFRFFGLLTLLDWLLKLILIILTKIYIL